jgi:hypothetical protein
VIGGFISAGLDGNPVWSLADSVELQTFVVARTEEGIRLTGPPLHPHMGGRAVLEGNLADEEYARAVDDAIRRKGGASVLDSIQRSAPAKSDALRLVEEYLRRDARGEFRQPSQWLAEVTTFESPGYEAITVVSDYDIVTEETKGDTSRITVQYDVVAGMSSGPDGPVWLFADSVEMQTFVVVTSEKEVRLVGPPLHPHIGSRAVLEYILADEALRRALEDAIRRKGW